MINARGGADVFLFGDETTNGKAETDRIHNFQARDDVIALEAGVEVEAIRQSGKNAVIKLAGDGDTIWLAGVDASDVVVDADWIA